MQYVLTFCRVPKVAFLSLLVLLMQMWILSLRWFSALIDIRDMSKLIKFVCSAFYTKLLLRMTLYRWDMLTCDLELVDSVDGHYDVVCGTYDPKFLTWYVNFMPLMHFRHS